MSTAGFTCPYQSSTIADPRAIFIHSCTAGTGAGIIPSATVPPTFGDSLLQRADWTDTFPRYDLGILNVGERIYFTL